MKKALVLFLTVIFSLSAFCACGNIEFDSGESSFDIGYNSGEAPADLSKGGAPADISHGSQSGEASGADAQSGEALSDEPAPSVDDISYTEISDDGAEFTFSEGLLFLGDRCMESFGGTYDSANIYSQIIRKYKGDLGDDVNLYSVVVPTASSVYLRNVVRGGVDFYERYGGNQADKLSYLDETFEGSGVTSVNVYDSLYKHWEEPLYFRTDFHWTQLGAYYAAEKFAEAAGLEFKTLGSGYYTKTGKYNDDGSPKPYYGYFYVKTKAPVLKNSPDEFFWYDFNHDYTVEYYDIEKATGFSDIAAGGKSGSFKFVRDTCYLHIKDDYVSSWYMTFLGGDNNICKINTGTKNGRTAVLFKDSFGNCFAPLLMSMYETVYVIDIRFFKGNSISFCKDSGADDVIFVISSYSAMGSNCSKIERMRTRQ